MTGKTLLRILTENEFTPKELTEAGVTDETLIRVNRQGDIEIRRSKGWDLIGGLLGDFEHRVQKETGLDWA